MLFQTVNVKLVGSAAGNLKRDREEEERVFWFSLTEKKILKY